MNNAKEKTELAEKQRVMHKNLFDKVKNALNNEFYFEAIFLEYSAIEGRLEIISGLLSLSCNKDIDDEKRRSVNISGRIKCIKSAYKGEEFLRNREKVQLKFFNQLQDWIKKRNLYMHGLLKNAELYNERIEEIKDDAKKGYELLSALYSETNSLKRYHHSGKYVCGVAYCSEKCKLIKEA